MTCGRITANAITNIRVISVNLAFSLHLKYNIGSQFLAPTSSEQMDATMEKNSMHI
jgi:hypothetical protein